MYGSLFLVEFQHWLLILCAQCQYVAFIVLTDWCAEYNNGRKIFCSIFIRLIILNISRPHISLNFADFWRVSPIQCRNISLGCQVISFVTTYVSSSQPRIPSNAIGILTLYFIYRSVTYTDKFDRRGDCGGNVSYHMFYLRAFYVFSLAMSEGYAPTVGGKCFNWFNCLVLARQGYKNVYALTCGIMERIIRTYATCFSKRVAKDNPAYFGGVGFTRVLVLMFISVSWIQMNTLVTYRSHLPQKFSYSNKRLG